MVKKLLQDHEKVIHYIAQLFPLAHAANDEATLDLLIKRTEEHEKNGMDVKKHY